MNRHVWSWRVAPGARNAWGRERERAKGPSRSYSWASSNAMQMKGFLYLLSSILGVWKAAWRLAQGDTHYTTQERQAEWTGSVCVCVFWHTFTVCMCCCVCVYRAECLEDLIISGLLDPLCSLTLTLSWATSHGAYQKSPLYKHMMDYATAVFKITSIFS